MEEPTTISGSERAVRWAALVLGSMAWWMGGMGGLVFRAEIVGISRRRAWGEKRLCIFANGVTTT